jgi:hypothetical protein
MTTLPGTASSDATSRKARSPAPCGAAVYVTHQVLPLDHAPLRQAAGQTIRSAEAFLARASRFATRAWPACVRVCVPFAPDSNLVCLALNPVGNREVEGMNRFVRELHHGLRCDPTQAVQTHEFYGSTTTLRPEAMGRDAMARVLAELGLDPASLLPEHDAADRLVILRHTLMNPFLDDRENGINYIERYFDYLARRIRALAANLAPRAAA